MARQKKQEILHPRVIHTMADGTVRDSIEGYVVPYNEKTAVCYKMLAKWVFEAMEREEKAKKDGMSAGGQSKDGQKAGGNDV